MYACIDADPAPIRTLQMNRSRLNQ